MTISGGTVNASGKQCGIHSVKYIPGSGTAGGNITISGDAVVTATGTGNASNGIYAGTVTISGGEVTATGVNQAIGGNLINTVAGIGWTNTAGTEGKALIPTSETARELTSKKVQFQAKIAVVTFKVENGAWDDETAEDIAVTLFGLEGDTLKLTAAQIPEVGTKPSESYIAGSWNVTPSIETAITAATTYTYTYAQKSAAVVKTAPVANTLTYTGSAQELVTAGEAEGGTIQYALGTDATTAPADNLYTTSIPTATDAGTYYVWYMAKGDETHGDSAPQAVTVVIAAPGQISVTVTFKVVNGAWGDGTRTDKTVVLTGNEGEELRLTLADIPRVTKPDEGYVFGSGTWTPSEPPIILEGEPMGDPITEDTTFTYTYAPENQISVTVTLKVMHGTWDDGTREDKTVVLTGYDDEELRLTLDDMPGVTKPDEGYKFGTGVWTPEEPPIDFHGIPMGDPITEDITFTYTYGVMPNVKTKTETKDLNAVPAALDDKYQTLEALKKDMLLNLVVAGKAAQMENTVFYDVELMVSTDDGKTWVPAAEENFPIGGITAILPYPTGTSAQTHNFAAAHMFTLSSGLLGTVAGEIEYPAVTANADGLHVQLNGLSPVAIAYEPIRPQTTKDPSKFEDVAVPSGTFSFTKVWEGDSEKSIDFTLYKIDGSVYHHGFDKKVVSNREWRYNAWFSSPAACYVIKKPMPGYITRYVNVGEYASVTDRCCDGGTTINKKIPKTGDETPILLWAGMLLIGAAGITVALTANKRRKAHK